MKISLRVKILGLVSGAVGLSLLSYLYIGTSLIKDDKLSYIYAYDQDQVRGVADALDARIERQRSVAAMAGQWISRPISARSERLIHAAFDELSNNAGVEELLFLRPDGSRRFKLELKYGDAADAAELALGRLGWTPESLRKTPEIFDTNAGNGQLALAGSTVDADGTPIMFFALAAPAKDKALFSQASAGFRAFLVGSTGGPIPIGSADDPASRRGPSLSDLTPLARALWKSGFPSGARDETVDSVPYIVAYSRLRTSGLLVFGLVSRAAAFAASRALVLRTLLLGLGIFLLALGGTLLFVRTVTSRLRQMWFATQKVSEGDFSVRVSADSHAEDEIVGLAGSFNRMAGKIDELMAATAQKARMEKELETAKVVQSLYFPSRPFEHAAVHLAGQCVSASECSGDWWHYALMGDRLVVMVGDVTGHGVSAALVTSATHSTFAGWVTENAGHAPDETALALLIERLNSAVIAAGGGRSNMTMVASVIDLQSGKIFWINAAHPQPYLYRKTRDMAAATPASGQRPTAMMGTPTAPLGQNPKIEPRFNTLQLLPGDRIFWYTDGLLETRPSDQRKTSKPALLKKLAQLADRRPQDARAICASVIDDAITFFGNSPESRPDDITVIVAVVRAGVGYNLAL